MIHPRKVYPVDPGIIPVYERAGRPNLGAALETAILIELERRGSEIAYVRTHDGYEVDFLAHAADGAWSLIQVCADLSDAATRERKVRALLAATAEYPTATPLLITLDAVPLQPALPAPLQWRSAAAWLLDGD